jgi:hypothetical protein
MVVLVCAGCAGLCWFVLVVLVVLVCAGCVVGCISGAG